MANSGRGANSGVHNRHCVTPGKHTTPYDKVENTKRISADKVGIWDGNDNYHRTYKKMNAFYTGRMARGEPVGLSARVVKQAQGSQRQLSMTA